MVSESQKGIVGFIIKYKITIVFAFLFIALFKQSILINNFPSTVSERQNLINRITADNDTISRENTALSKQIDDYIDDNLILIESQARYKYGLVKDGETYYQINAIVKTNNTNETPESNP